MKRQRRKPSPTITLPHIVIAPDLSQSEADQLGHGLMAAQDRVL